VALQVIAHAVSENIFGVLPVVPKVIERLRGRRGGGEKQNGCGRCKEFHEVSLMAKIRAVHVSSSSASARPEVVMLHLQRLAVNSPGRPLYLEPGVGLESRSGGCGGRDAKGPAMDSIVRAGARLQRSDAPGSRGAAFQYSRERERAHGLDRRPVRGRHLGV